MHRRSIQVPQLSGQTQKVDHPIRRARCRPARSLSPRSRSSLLLVLRHRWPRPTMSGPPAPPPIASWALAGVLSLGELLPPPSSTVLGIAPAPAPIDPLRSVVPALPGGLGSPQPSADAVPSVSEPAVAPAGASDTTTIAGAVSLMVGAVSRAASESSIHAPHGTQAGRGDSRLPGAWWRAKDAASPWSAATPQEGAWKHEPSPAHGGAAAHSQSPSNAPSVPAPLFPDPTQQALIGSGSATPAGPSGAAVVGALVGLPVHGGSSSVHESATTGALHAATWRY